MPLFRLQIMMAAVAGRDDGIRKAISDNYRGAIDPWVRIYEETFAARGPKPRREDHFGNSQQLSGVERSPCERAIG
jgi:hypothetical protein